MRSPHSYAAAFAVLSSLYWLKAANAFLLPTNSLVTKSTASVTTVSYVTKQAVSVQDAAMDALVNKITDQTATTSSVVVDSVSSKVMPPPETIPIIQTPIEESLTRATTAAPSSSEVIQAFRDNHWAKIKMPVITQQLPTFDQDDMEAPAFMDYVKNIKNGQVSLNFDTERTLQGLEKLKNNLKLDGVAVSFGEFAASLAAVQTILQQSSREGGVFSSEEIANAMNIKETGVWYFGASGLLFLLLVSIAGTRDNVGSVNRKIVMTPAATPDKKSSSALAPDKKSSSALEQAQDSDRDLLEAQVQKLKEATKAVNAQLNEMKAEKSIKDYDVATMKSELRTVMNMLEANKSEEDQLRISLKSTQEKLEQETTSLRQQLQERVAAEEQLSARLAETEEKLASERKKADKAKADANKMVAEAQKEVKKLESEKELMENEMSALRKEMEALKEKAPSTSTTPEKPTSAPKAPADSPSPEKATAVPEVTKAKSKIRGETEAKTTTASAKKSALPKTQPSSMETAYFSDIAEPVERKSRPTIASKKVAAKKAPAKSSPAKKAAAAASDDSEDWSKLSQSTLKRKTVKQLTVYLEEKGAPTTGSDGKTLKKDLLIETVLAQ